MAKLPWLDTVWKWRVRCALPLCVVPVLFCVSGCNSKQPSGTPVQQRQQQLSDGSSKQKTAGAVVESKKTDVLIRNLI